MFAGVWVVELIWLCVGCGFPGVSVWVCCLRLGFAFWSLLQCACSGLTLLLAFVGFVGVSCGCGLGWYSVSCLRIFGLLLFRLRVVCWLLRLVWRLCCTWVA